MSNKSNGYSNIVLISQISINIMVPIFLCLAIGMAIEKYFSIPLTIPLLFLGFAAGGRNAYILAMKTIRADEARRKKEEEDMIKRKLENANKKEK